MNGYLRTFHIELTVWSFSSVNPSVSSKAPLSVSLSGQAVYSFTMIIIIIIMVTVLITKHKVTGELSEDK